MSSKQESVKVGRRSAKKPSDGAFVQQSLPAWQPVMTPRNVLPTLFVIGILFCTIGGLLWWNSNKVDEIMINYSYCNEYADPVYLLPRLYSYKLSSNDKFQITNDQAPVYHSTNETTFLDSTWYSNPNQLSIKRCTIDFTVPTTMKGPVFLYYRLTNFYQNHRQYIKSFDNGQLSGSAVPQSTVDDSCGSLGTVPGDNSIIYYPCGLVANSMFNDTFSNLTSINSETPLTYEFSQTNLAWPVDKKKYGPTQYNPTQIAPPPNWATRYPNGRYSAEFPPPDLSKWEAFMVWMHLAALPDFRKIWGRNDNNDLTAGRWRISIDMNYDVLSFEGSKWIVLSTKTPLGGRNPFLGIAYMTMGALAIVFGIIFSVRQLVKPRKLRDEQYSNWNRQHANAKKRI